MGLPMIIIGWPNTQHWEDVVAQGIHDIKENAMFDVAYGTTKTSPVEKGLRIRKFPNGSGIQQQIFFIIYFTLHIQF